MWKDSHMVYLVHINDHIPENMGKIPHVWGVRYDFRVRAHEFLGFFSFDRKLWTYSLTHDCVMFEVPDYVSYSDIRYTL